MSELQQYYNDFCSGYWADPDPNNCRCRGCGYVLSEVDTWHECPYHYKKGQRHPEDDSCPECDDGNNFPSSDCKTCGKQVQQEMNEIWKDVTGEIVEEKINNEWEIPF